MELVKTPNREDIKDLMAWLSEKTGRYNPEDPRSCLVCQYMSDREFKNTTFSGTQYLTYVHGRDRDTVSVKLPKAIAEIAYGEGNPSLESNNFEYTYEAAFERAERVLNRMF